MWKAIKEFFGHYDTPAAPKVQAAPKTTKAAAPKKAAAKVVKKTTKKNGK